MARTTTEHQIVIQSANLNGVVRLEGIADEAFMPGRLLSVDNAEEYQNHNSAVGVLPGKLIALETQTPDTDTYPTTAAIDIPYVADETCYVAQGQPGDVYNMWLADGYTAVKGQSMLASNGDGALRVVTVAAGTFTNSIVGTPDEDCNNSLGGTAVRLRVRIV